MVWGSNPVYLGSNTPGSEHINILVSLRADSLDLAVLDLYLDPFVPQLIMTCSEVVITSE